MSEYDLEEFCCHIISAIVLIYLANSNEYNMLTAYGIDKEKKSEIFDDLMQDLISLFTQKGYNEKQDEIYNEHGKQVYNSLQKYSLFFNIYAYNENIQHSSHIETINFIDFFDSKKHYAIFQKRESNLDRWCSYIIIMDQRKGIYNFLEELIFAEIRNRKIVLGYRDG